MILALKNALISEPASLSDGRKSTRFDIVEPCRVERWGKSYHAMTRNISSGGMALDIVGMGSTAHDADLTIYLRDFEPLVANARWTHKRTFGVQFISDGANHAQLQDLLTRLPASQK